MLENKVNFSELNDFMQSYNVIRLDTNKYVNISSASNVIDILTEELHLPLQRFYLDEKIIKMMLNHRI